jgi:hypothetical protein
MRALRGHKLYQFYLYQINYFVSRKIFGENLRRTEGEVIYPSVS